MDIYLQDLVKDLDSYLRDSDHLINILKETTWQEGLSFLTLDVTALYLNIDHDLGVECVEKALRNDREITDKQRSFLADSLNFILENNYFQYEDSIYWQRKGTAMGTRVAPSFANIFMGAFEDTHIYIYNNNTLREKCGIYKRFIDDLFVLWNVNEDEAMEFANNLNQNQWGITFTSMGSNRLNFWTYL